MRVLLILNDPPYRTERAYNALMDARGDSESAEVAQRSTMDEFAKETMAADKVIVW